MLVISSSSCLSAVQNQVSANLKSLRRVHTVFTIHIQGSPFVMLQMGSTHSDENGKIFWTHSD